MLKTTLTTAVLIVAAAGAQATTFVFDATLDSAQSTTESDSTATGTARLMVDDVAETLDFLLDVNGITLNQLDDSFVAAPVGPIHLHDAVAGQTGPVVIPFPFGSSFSATDGGFSLNMMDYAFSDAVSTSGSDESFETFVAGLFDRSYYINIHTDQFGSGEIRGQLSPVPLPAGLPLAIGAFGLLAFLRRKAA